MKMMSPQARSKSTGFTLIELIIVIVVIGFLAIIGTNAFSNAGVSDGAKAQAMFESATKLSQNTVLLAQAAGTSSVVTGSTLPTNATTTLMDVLIRGETSFNTATYPNAWRTSGVTAMPSLAQGSGSAYTIAGYSVTMGGGGNDPHTFTFADVPDSVTQHLVAKYGSSAASLAAAGDATNAVIRYGAPTSGLRTVTIRSQL